MNTLNLTLPDALHTFVQQQATLHGCGSDEYLRQLVTREQAREALRALLLDGAASSPSAPVDAAYFARLRAQVQRHTATGAQE